MGRVVTEPTRHAKTHSVRTCQWYSRREVNRRGPGGKMAIHQRSDFCAAFSFCRGCGQLTDCQHGASPPWLINGQRTHKLQLVQKVLDFVMSDFKLSLWVFPRNTEYGLQYLSWQMSISGSHPIASLRSHQFCFCSLPLWSFPEEPEYLFENCRAFLHSSKVLGLYVKLWKGQERLPKNKNKRKCSKFWKCISKFPPKSWVTRKFIF